MVHYLKIMRLNFFAYRFIFKDLKICKTLHN